MENSIDNNDVPDIGAMLRKYVDEKRIRQVAWGRKQGTDARTVAGYLKKKKMHVHTLLTICRVLNYNFFKEILSTLPADMPPYEENPCKKKTLH